MGCSSFQKHWATSNYCGSCQGFKALEEGQADVLQPKYELFKNKQTNNKTKNKQTRKKNILGLFFFFLKSYFYKLTNWKQSLFLAW